MSPVFQMVTLEEHAYQAVISLAQWTSFTLGYNGSQRSGSPGLGENSWGVLYLQDLWSKASSIGDLSQMLLSRIMCYRYRIVGNQSTMPVKGKQGSLFVWCELLKLDQPASGLGRLSQGIKHLLGQLEDAWISTALGRAGWSGMHL